MRRRVSGKPDVRLKLGRATTVEGPFGLVGMPADLRELARRLNEAAEGLNGSEEVEVWLGPSPYGPDAIASELERLASKVRGNED